MNGAEQLTEGEHGWPEDSSCATLRIGADADGRKLRFTTLASNDVGDYRQPQILDSTYVELLDFQ
jgi:hypothetical protein